jgi:uncharacterized integral membrane protein
MAPKLLIGLLILLFLVSFAAKNGQTVTVAYYFGYQFETWLWAVGVVAFVAGVLLTGAIWGVSALMGMADRGRLRKQVARLEQELSDIRKRPLPDEPPLYRSSSPVGGGSEPASLPSRSVEPKRLPGA